METWFIIILTLCISALIKSFLNLIYPIIYGTPKLNLPPGPSTVPIIGSFLWLKKSFSELEPLLRTLQSRYGPMVTLRIGSRAAIFVSDRAIAHSALVQNGSVFSDRPPANVTNKLITSNQHNISSAAYGPTWRLLRRNLTAEILHPSRIKSYGRARKWVLEILMKRFEIGSKDGRLVRVADHFQYAMFCLLVFMCFGDRVDEVTLRSIERVQRNLLLGFSRFNVLNFWPSIGRIVFRKRWAELIRLKKNQEDVLIPLIRSRKQLINESKSEEHDDQNPSVLSYVDTLFELNLPDEKRKLNENEIVSLCSEFLNAGTDTTSTALQWIMANLVKNPKIQNKLTDEINGVLGSDAVEVEEDDLHKMPYLKAVILEGLRRHPPGHFVLPHSVTEDVSLNGYLIPKNGNLNFMVAEMGWDPNVWEDPMQFKPERFLVNSDGEDDDVVFDLTCNREIKMMPFGAGRRMCPASGLAMLHLEYFVANLVRRFEWTSAADGDEVDLSEKQEFTVVMKNPLNAHLSPRVNSIPLS